jgi:hypothetical protein
MLCGEELARHLSAHSGAVRGWDRPVPGQTGGRVEGSDPLSDLHPKRAHITIEDLERRPEPHHRQEIGLGEIRPFQLPDSLFGQGVHARAEQGPHLLRSHRVLVEVKDQIVPRRLVTADVRRSALG